MRITKFWARGYRSLKDVTLDPIGPFAVFYGPNGSQHVAIFLGNGQMIEAPYTGSVVKISPLRTGGMTPFAIRYVEF